MDRACLSRVDALIGKVAAAAADKLPCLRMGAGKHSANDS